MPDNAIFRQTVDRAGCAIIGQTGDLAPADKRLYAIRDVTATVESIPLITASILSKKLAAGLQSLVLDVKVGNGAFMAKADDAEALARSLVRVANGAGVKTTALLTDMNEPLADCAGNAIEVQNAVDFLKGQKSGTRLEEVTLALGAEMLVNAGVERDQSEALGRCAKVLASGEAAEIFGRMVAELGGPTDFMDKAKSICRAARSRSRFLPSKTVISQSATHAGSGSPLSPSVVAASARATRSITVWASPASGRWARRWRRASRSPLSRPMTRRPRHRPQRQWRVAIGFRERSPWQRRSSGCASGLSESLPVYWIIRSLRFSAV